jgi:hypothetical protein
MPKINLTNMNKKHTSKGAQLTWLRQFAAGCVKHLAGQTLTVSEATIKVDDLVAQIAALDAAVTAVATAEAAWKQQLEAANQAAAAIETSIQLMRGYVKVLLGARSPTLLDFGITPDKVPVRTAATALAAVALNKATREARHTMGKKQKAKIHGSVAPAAATEPASQGSPANDPVAPSGTAPKG